MKLFRRNTESAPTLSYASSPLLNVKTPVWRSRLLVAGVGLAFAGLLGRAVYVQVWAEDFFQTQGEQRYGATLELPASRGRIQDRNGSLLASSVAVPSAWGVPQEVDRSRVAELAKLLDLPQAELDKKLASPGRFVWLKRELDDASSQALKAAKIKGVYQDREFRRRYPEGEASAHVVGFTNLEDRGQEGIELAFQRQLQGQDGRRAVVRDRLGRIVEDMGDTLPAQHGQDVQLSLDAKVQFFAYQRLRDAVAEHKAKAGSVVVLDAQTGEVLALANYPSFDPATRKNLTGNQLRNRAITDVFEPGSTMKPFVAALALESGKVKPDTVINANPSSINISGWHPTDVHRYDALTVQQVIQKSSNVGTTKLAMMFERQEMHEMFSGIGLGQRPQLQFPGAVSGRLRPWKSWRPIEQATMSYGYGLSASLLQLARAYTVFAHDGELLPVTLNKRQPGEPVQGVRVFSPETAREVRTMLEMATTTQGTGPKAQVLGYSVGGKSGTAHKQEGKGYASNKYRSWFVGLSPISKPRVVVAVMVDEPSNGVYYGGAVAAPVFSQVVAQTLRLMNVAPDLDVQSQIVAMNAGAKQAPVLESF
ncbi:cell division protein FtsI (penicillin-binding protein 3) [Inhella inkyongensis]|uniref:Peptidoglycan D,D-transpeptidase FtsI n=1 Tax=Inhella inkyongensis TaxID=392593 RepID=A0A840S1P4_9BURK|nr:penicillin-binding protein 2 [Inhella inkyongensis]MBB5203442.1 cell division protein FtsI (penicillin-binding protein 3) [Inhella inkyongensis]